MKHLCYRVTVSGLTLALVMGLTLPARSSDQKTRINKAKAEMYRARSDVSAVNKQARQAIKRLRQAEEKARQAQRQVDLARQEYEEAFRRHFFLNMQQSRGWPAVAVEDRARADDDEKRAYINMHQAQQAWSAALARHRESQKGVAQAQANIKRIDRWRNLALDKYNQARQTYYQALGRPVPYGPGSRTGGGRTPGGYPGARGGF